MIEKLAENPNSAALGWLLEMELINSPTVLNSIILNMFKNVKGIRDADFVIDTKGKKVLIYLELSKWSEWFHKKEIESQIADMFTQILPAFAFRVVFDKKILNLALDIINPNKNKVLRPINVQK